jgi:RimJ/RimL family protein N-acetyltransferase
MEDEPPVRLAPLEDSHVARYLSLSADPVLIDTMGWKPYDPDDAERFLRYVENITVPYLMGGRTVALSIVSTADGTPIGYLSLKGVREGGTGAEIGLAIMDKDYRGRGLGTIALRQAAEYAFDELELSVLVLTVFPGNEPAIRSYEKVGFEKTELLKEAFEMADETFADMWVMELSRDDFANAKARAGSSANST